MARGKSAFHRLPKHQEREIMQKASNILDYIPPSSQKGSARAAGKKAGRKPIRANTPGQRWFLQEAILSRPHLWQLKPEEENDA